MITLIGGVIQLILLVLARIFEANSAKKKEQIAIIKELADAIKAGNTSDITAALSGLR